jgi:hypothetical protein
LRRSNLPQAAEKKALFWPFLRLTCPDPAPITRAHAASRLLLRSGVTVEIRREKRRRTLFDIVI